MKKTVFRKEYIDPETAEIVNAIAIIPEAKGPDGDFTKVYRLCSMQVLQDLKTRGLNGAAITLWWFVHNMQMNSEIIFAHPKNVAADIGMSEVQVRKHFKLLLKYGYIDQLTPRQNIYRVNTHFIYRGTLKREKVEL